MNVETLKVDSLTKFGFKSGKDYVNFSKFFPADSKTTVVPGAVLSFDVYVSNSGKKYVNSVVEADGNVKPNVVTDVTPPLDTKHVASKKEYKAKEDTAMTRADWEAKDTRISRQGMFQAAIQALAPVVSLETLVEEAEKLADAGLEYVNR